MNVTRRLLVLFVALTMVVSVAAPPAAAQSQPPWAEGLYNDFADVIPTYNEEVGSLNLGLGDGLLENQRVTVRITEGDETAYMWFDTDGNKRIVDHGLGQHPNDATLVIRTDRRTINEIANSRSPVSTFRQAVSDNRIRFSGQTVGTFVLGTVVSIGQRLGLM